MHMLVCLFQIYKLKYMYSLFNLHFNSASYSSDCERRAAGCIILRDNNRLNICYNFRGFTIICRILLKENVSKIFKIIQHNILITLITIIRYIWFVWRFRKPESVLKSVIPKCNFTKLRPC